MKKYSTFLTILCIILSMCSIGIVGYAIYNYYDNYTADQSAEELMAQFEETFDEEEQEPEEQEQPIVEQPSIPENNNQNTTSETTDKNITKPSYNIGTYYKGYKIIGIINIPKLNIQYPIFNVDNTATLRVGTAAIYPANVEQALNKPGNVVIAGHNYRNSRMFSKLHTLQAGDSIYITNTVGKKLEYKVYNNYTADVNDFTYATRETDDSIEISLSTCTNSSKTRTVVWARVEQ